jgi:MtaA/CmuA family methyltransferase
MSTMTGRERVLGLIWGRAVDRLPAMPITMMFAARQAGVKYGDYASDHRVLVDAQIHVAAKFGFDQVSCISDPAREVADCGGTIHCFDDQPPAMDEENALLADKKALAALRQPDPLGGGRMHDRVNAAALFRQRVGGQKLIEGWSEGPVAEAADLRGINNLMLDFFDDPDFVRELFEFVLVMELSFARAQIEAGVDIIGIGDAAASLVGPDLYNQFVWPYEKRMIDGVHALGSLVRLHICGNMRPNLQMMGRLGADIVDLDYPCPVDEARAAMGPMQVLLGNLEPVAILRNGTARQVREATLACRRAAGERYIIGPGCEIPPDTPEENVRAMMDVAG